MDLKFRTGKEILAVKLLIDESLLDRILDFCDEENIESVESGKFIVNFPFVEDDYWYNTILHFGDKCECLEPEHVRLELINRIKKILSVYND